MTINKLRPFFYGLSELGPASIDIFLKVYLLVFFNTVLGLPPAYASTAIGLSVLWDALIDPWIGRMSDRYYHQKGTRLPLMIFGLILILLSFVLMWNFNLNSHVWNSIFLFLTSALLNSSISLFSLPYFALANDLEPHDEKRKKWIGWRLAFFNIGSFIGLVVPAYYLTQKESTSSIDSGTPYKSTVYVLIGITLVATLISLYFVYKGMTQKERKETENEHEHQSFWLLIKDKRFLQILSSFFVVNCGIGLNSSLAIYYYQNYLEYNQKQIQTILVGFLAIFTFAIPLWVVLTKYFSKKNLIIFGALALGLTTMWGFPQYKGWSFTWVFVLASGVGGILVGVAVVLEIFLSDFMKEKELETKQIISGQYLGFWKMSSKISRAIAIALSGPIIEASSGNPLLLAQFFGFGVGSFFILSAALMLVPFRK